ncbi:uncharacterized bromodomain-containing protein 10-like [Periplaneta americana]|uniref:uncharacterized bromodomain-containing protein 10-like n=1 Tax=Periplaneta americana TaxID=6978 RepID=UPI0037E9AD82
MDESNDPSYTPSGAAKLRKGRPKREVPLLENPTLEISDGYRILQDIMGISKFFLEEPNNSQKGLLDYYDVISKPMCFLEIERKFVDNEYSKISEFVSDVRLLLLNCYRYFGPDDIHTKRALHVERVLEEKLSNLPEKLARECSLESTHPDLKNGTEDCESHLLHSVREEREHRESERKRQLSEEYRKQGEGENKEIFLWEKELLAADSVSEHIPSMWELPVIGHFIALSLEHLNINKISMFELERMFVIPQASKNLSILMTSLLSTPLTRMKLHMKPPMPYKIWTRKLLHKVSGWYKVYAKSNNDAQSVFEKTGIEPQFWKIMGDWNPLEQYEFHELTFHQRVHLVKALCDYIFQNHRSLRDNISEKVEEYGSCLGEDRSGTKFLYFPQFLDQDVRIYKQNKEVKSWIDRDLEHIAELEHQASLKFSKSLMSAKKRRKRRMGWKKGNIVKARKVSKSVNRLHSKDTSCKSSIKCVISVASKSVPTVEREKSQKGEVMNETIFKEGNKLSQRIQESALLINDTCENLGALKSETTINSSHNNKTSDEPEIKSGLIDTLHENYINGAINEDNSLRTSKARSPDKEVSAGPIEHEHEKKVEPIIVVRDKNDFVVKDVPLPSESATTARRPLHNPYWLAPDPDDFTLVADSVEGVRQLLGKYSNSDDLPLSERLDNVKARRGKYPACEARLVRRLTALLSDLESVELKMIMGIRMTREKLFSEWKSHLNRPADYEDPDEAFWLDEKEPVDVPECFTPEAPCPQNLDAVEDFELSEVKTEDEHLTEGGMKLRHRNQEDRLLNIESSEDSTEQDSDESDNWVMPRHRKRKRSKTLKMIGSPLQPCKKRAVMIEVQSRKQDECKQSTVTADSEPEIEILEISKRPLEMPALRVKKRLFQEQEISSTEANQFKLDENSKKFVNSVSNKPVTSKTNSHSTPTRIIIDSNSKIILDDNGVITNSKALPKLQGRKIGDVVKEAKVVKNKGLLTGVISVEMESIQSGSVTGQNHDRKNTADRFLNSFTSVRGVGKHCGTTEQERLLKNIVHVFKESDKSTSGDQQPVVLVPSVSNKGHTVLYEKVVGEKAKKILENTKRNTNSTNHNSQINGPSTQIPKQQLISQERTPTQKVPQGCTLTQSVPQTQAPQQLVTQLQSSTIHPQVQVVPPTRPIKTGEIVCISDDSDGSEVEFLDIVYNPKLDRNCKPKNSRNITHRSLSSTSSQLTLTEENSVNSVTKGPSVTSTTTSMLVAQSRSTGMPQVQSPGVPVPQVRSPSNPLPQVRCPGTPVVRTQSPGTPVSQLRSPANPVLQLHSLRTPMSQLRSPGTSTLQSQSPGTLTSQLRSPRTPILQVRNSGTPLSQLRSPGMTQLRSPGIPVSHLRSPGIPMSQLRGTGTTVSQFRSPGTPVSQSRGSGSPLAQLQRPGTAVAQLRSPGTLVAQLRSPGTPVAQLRSPGTPVAQLRSPGITLAQSRNPGTPVAQLRSPGTPVTHLMSPRNSASQIRTDVQATTVNTPRQAAQARSPRLQSPQAQVRMPAGSPRQSDGQHQTGKTTARLIVIHGGTSSNYALAFPNGNKVILNPEQLARLRAANGGQLATSIGLDINFEL